MKLINNSDKGYLKGERVENLLVEFLKLFRGLFFFLIRDIKKFLKTFTTDLGSKSLLQNGYLIVENYLDEDLCNEYTNHIKTFISSNMGNKDFGDGCLVQYRTGLDEGMIDITNPHKQIPLFNDLLKNAKMIDSVVNNASLENVRLRRSIIYINKNITRTRSYHIDSAHISQYKAFLYLEDVSEKDGPFSIIKKSNRFNRFKYYNMVSNFFKRRLLNDMPYYDKIKRIDIIGKRGTLIISDQNAFHRGIPQKKGGERSVFVYNYF